MKRILIFLLFIPKFAYCNWNDGLGDDIAMAAGAATGRVIWQSWWYAGRRSGSSSWNFIRS
ncbi:MAG: hypothetical protein DI619_01820 [Francisella sp.]|nr:MAG: hypothetical protein DI619_01820 [Francisella sp.]